MDEKNDAVHADARESVGKEKNRKRRQRNRLNESSEQKKVRLDTDRKQHREKRKEESKQQTSILLEKARTRMRRNRMEKKTQRDSLKPNRLNCLGIVRASTNQADESIFQPSMYAGRQCCSMAIASCIKSSLVPPSEWTTSVVDQMMREAHQLYIAVREMSKEDAIPVSGYLNVNNFLVMRNSISIFEKTFELEFDIEPMIYGSLIDVADPIGPKLEDGIEELFKNHSTGVVIIASKSFGLFKSNGSFFMFDSHSANAFGKPASSGCAYLVQTSNIHDLAAFVAQAAGGSSNIPYTLDYVDVIETQQEA